MHCNNQVNLSPVPSSSGTANIERTNCSTESSRREIKVVLGASRAAVDNSEDCGFALVLDPDLATTWMLAVVERGGDGANEFVIVVSLAAGAEAGIIPGDGASVGRSCAGFCLSGSRRAGEGQTESSESGGNERNHCEIVRNESILK